MDLEEIKIPGIEIISRDFSEIILWYNLWVIWVFAGLMDFCGCKFNSHLIGGISQVLLRSTASSDSKKMCLVKAYDVRTHNLWLTYAFTLWTSTIQLWMSSEFISLEYPAYERGGLMDKTLGLNAGIERVRIAQNQRALTLSQNHISWCESKKIRGSNPGSR